MSIALFIVAKTWKQPKSIKEWMDKENVWYLYTQWNIIYPLKNDQNLTIFNNMDWPWGHYAKWNKSEKDKYHMISLICGILKQTQRPRAHGYTEWVGGCQKGWVGKGLNE